MNQIISLDTVPRWDGTPNPPVQYDVEYLDTPDLDDFGYALPVEIITITNIRTRIVSDDPITWREVQRILDEGAV